jgi:tyrosinase
MAALRRNLLADPAVRDAYVTGVQSLKSEFLGPTTSDFNIPGPVQQVSTYDLFTVWHHLAMGRMTPPTQMTGTPLIAAQYSCPGTA